MKRIMEFASVAVLVSIAFLPACGDDGSDTDVGLANPASVFCKDQGGTVEIERDAAGNETGICVFPDGTRVDEWEYFRDNSPSATTLADRPPTEVDAYATALVEAWERGDRETAAGFATEDALGVLFSRDGGGATTWTLESCEGTAGSSYCTFGAGGDAKVIVRVSNEIAQLGGPAGAIEIRFAG